MKFCLVFFIVLSCFTARSQVDTIILDYSEFSKVNEKPNDAYYIIKKNGIKVQEYNWIKSKIIGLFKSYYENGSIEEIINYDLYQGRNMYSGIYQMYYPNGNIKTEGIYQIQDSIECIGCYNTDLLKAIYRAQSNTMKIGIWKEYHENGVLSAKGMYKGIHEINNSEEQSNNNIDFIGVFYVGTYTEDYLKNGLWEYFDEVGKLVKEETYKNGFLVGVIRH